MEGEGAATTVRMPSLRKQGAFLVSGLAVTSAFLAPVRVHRPGSAQGKPRPLGQLGLSAYDEKGVDDMRRLLEASWNVETMGSVPTNADSAAEAAAMAIDNAKTRVLSASQHLFHVDLLLPQYDIRQGSNLYDEVLAVEFCVALSKRLKGRSAIVVRDNKTIQTVTRVLNARERDRQRATNLPDDESDEEEEDDENEEDPDYDEDFGSVIGDESADLESFRDQLISGWREEIQDRRRMRSDAPSEPAPPVVAGYRLASMLGSATISSGADMTDDVIKAVSANAQPRDEEDTLIILSAASREEMIGVRGLVSKFGGKKTIILVNCYLNPPPRELMNAQTVYSIQPFLARPKVSEGNIFGSNKQPSDLNQQQSQQPQASPKIVLMRRYPRDWEIFVDVGNGFELARTVSASQVDKKGPSMEFIAGCVKQFMQSRLG